MVTTTPVSDALQPTPRRWPVLRSLQGYQAGWIAPDLAAGLTLAAIAIPEQMATARLAMAPPQLGLFAFIGGTLAFAVFGTNRRLSAGADSTITPIFAGGLAMLATAGSPQIVALAAALALLVGAIVLSAGLLRMGWIGALLSVPVTTGFLAGIAVHIIVSQLPGALGLPQMHGATLERLAELPALIPRANLYAAAVAGGVLLIVAGAERLSGRIPGALIAVALAAALVAVLHLEARGVALLGAVAAGLPRFAPPHLSAQDLLRLLPLAGLIALVVMVQTAATTSAFPNPGDPSGVNGDFVGLGAGNIVAGLLGAFPVDASPPRTAIVAQGGGRSQLSGLAAVAIVVALLFMGTGVLRLIPEAALSGVLLFVALRVIRVGQIRAVMVGSRLEALLIGVTAAAIVVLPIETGVAIGIGLSLLHGAWSNARVRVRPMQRIPGATIWWPAAGSKLRGETLPGVTVLAFQAPLSFLNADGFARAILDALPGPGADGGSVKLIVLEAAGVVDIDFTAGEAFKRVILACHKAGVTFALARLESVAAQRAFVRLGLRDRLGEDHVFASVAEAIAALGPKDAKPLPAPAAPG